MADEPVFFNDQVVGWVTSGAYGHCVQMSLAQAYVDSSVATEDNFTVEILGNMHPASRLAEPPYDPSGSKMRGA
ncbi:glycine cleavage T C-terminal barrel domain-containing protein [Aliamphritea spongicola]|nr:glycine cleavage T C-terminal barrel domain-containing protein [Aliamphritea spongicola]